jgi:dihydrofolate reductase
MKNKLIGIVAMTDEGVIAIDGKLPVKSKVDMKHFKETTEGNIVIMGNTTYKTLNGQLPNRLNIVLTKSKIDGDPSTRPYYTDSILNAIRYQPVGDTRDLYVIGGTKVYRAMLPMCDEVIITVFSLSTVEENFDDELTLFPFKVTVFDEGVLVTQTNVSLPSLNSFFPYYEIERKFEENGIIGRIIRFKKEI